MLVDPEIGTGLQTIPKTVIDIQIGKAGPGILAIKDGIINGADIDKKKYLSWSDG